MQMKKKAEIRMTIDRKEPIDSMKFAVEIIK